MDGAEIVGALGLFEGRTNGEWGAITQRPKLPSRLAYRPSTKVVNSGSGVSSRGANVELNEL
jgi:hypothetical protein